MFVCIDILNEVTLNFVKGDTVGGTIILGLSQLRGKTRFGVVLFCNFLDPGCKDGAKYMTLIVFLGLKRFKLAC